MTGGGVKEMRDGGETGLEEDSFLLVICLDACKRGFSPLPKDDMAVCGISWAVDVFGLKFGEKTLSVEADDFHKEGKEFSDEGFANADDEDTKIAAEYASDPFCCIFVAGKRAAINVSLFEEALCCDGDKTDVL